MNTRKSDPISKPEILFVHGLSEYGDRHGEMTDFFEKAGYHVKTFDLVGHGNRKGESPKNSHWFASFLSDLEKQIQQLNEQGSQPILFGHSLGGTIVLERIVGKGLEGLRAAIVSSPFFMPSGFAQTVLFRIVSKSGRRFPDFSLPGKGLASKLTNDKAKQKEYRQDPHILKQIPLGLLYELKIRGEEIYNSQHHLPEDILFCSGEDDPVCGFNHFKSFLEKQKVPHRNFSTWPQARHELMNETIRYDYFVKILDWLIHLKPEKT